MPSVLFLETRTVERAGGPTYESGSVYQLTEAQARLWVKRGVAKIVPDEIATEQDAKVGEAGGEDDTVNEATVDDDSGAAEEVSDSTDSEEVSEDDTTVPGNEVPQTDVEPETPAEDASTPARGRGGRRRS